METEDPPDPDEENRAYEGAVGRPLARKLLAKLLAQKSKSTKTAKSKKSYKSTAKKYYNDVKKAKTREMNTKKKAELAAGRAAIKRLPKKQQAAARKKLTAAVKSKYDKLKKLLPPAGKKTAAELTGLMKRMRTLRV